MTHVFDLGVGASRIAFRNGAPVGGPALRALGTRIVVRQHEMLFELDGTDEH